MVPTTVGSVMAARTCTRPVQQHLQTLWCELGTRSKRWSWPGKWPCRIILGHVTAVYLVAIPARGIGRDRRDAQRRFLQAWRLRHLLPRPT